MRLTKEHIEVMQDAVTQRGIRKDKAPKEQVRNICGYLNRLNLHYRRFGATVLDDKVDEIKLPKLMSSIIEPRYIRYDITREDMMNLRNDSDWNPVAVVTKIVQRPLEKIEIDEAIGELTEEHPELESCTREELEKMVPQFHESEEVVEIPNYEAIIVTPPEYGYNEFVRDMKAIALYMRAGEIQFTETLPSAAADINVLTIIDKISRDGYVKWDASPSSAYIPYHVKGFDVGLSDAGYDYTEMKMFRTLMYHRIEEFFTK